MKKLITYQVLAVLATSVFGQGKINLINDAGSLLTLTTDPSRVLAADQGLMGQAIGNINPLPSGITLVAGLYGGTSAGNLFLFSTYTMNSSAPGTAGVIGPLHIVLNANANGAPNIPGIANNTPIGANTPWFQVRVWDSSYPTYEAAAATGQSYITEGLPFQMNPGPSIAYVNTSPSANSTWQDSDLAGQRNLYSPHSGALCGNSRCPRTGNAYAQAARHVITINPICIQ